MRVISRERARHGAAALDSWHHALDSAVAMLARFPRAGRPLSSDTLGEHREIRVKEYRVIYSVDAQVVRVREVVHARRDWDPKQLTLLP